MKNCLSNDGQFFVIKTLIVLERVLKQISNIHSVEFAHCIKFMLLLGLSPSKSQSEYWS